MHFIFNRKKNAQKKVFIALKHISNYKNIIHSNMIKKNYDR